MPPRITKRRNLSDIALGEFAWRRVDSDTRRDVLRFTGMLKTELVGTGYDAQEVYDMIVDSGQRGARAVAAAFKRDIQAPTSA